ncbi:zf-C2HC5-domain-containing protein [Thozetella sp. PMI_491]|nr:zf-C2HC5-domain-containing protein [Thozetella sp. PMI_491]
MSITQLSRLLPLPDSELQQVLEYASTLSKAEAAEHFTNLLGDSPAVVDFVATFNSARAEPKAATPAASSGHNSEIDAVPKSTRGPKKKKNSRLHTPAPRQVAPIGPAPGAVYNKKDQQDDYISGRSNASTPAISQTGPSKPPPVPKTSTPPPAKQASSKPPPSAAGTLVSDLGLPKSKPKSNPISRTSTPGPSSKGSGNTTKVSITGGTPMHGASTALSDLDEAIRSLEVMTNPSHGSNSPANIASRRCNCVGARHPLQTAAPNCLSCGKVVCVKEGLGPCTFCGTPLLSSSEIQGMIKELKLERGRERQAADREAHKKADVSSTPRPFTKPRGAEDMGAAEAKAREHRDKLLGFQAQNARRTTVRDEASDFDVSHLGSMWATPEERAMELKKQQKLLRELEWNARPDYEKRRQVVSIDIVKGKVVRKMAAVERPPSPEVAPEPEPVEPVLEETSGNRGAGGAFSRNPLLGGLVKPVYDAKGKGPELEGRDKSKPKWRRVQDELRDNEAIILDGGIQGGSVVQAGRRGDEPDCG